MRRLNYGMVGIVAVMCLCMVTIQGCEEAAKQCGFECSAEGLAEGNASITGVASVDAFFGAVVDFEAEATAVADGINGALGKIYASVGLEGEPGADFSGEFQAKLKAKFGLEGDVKVAFQEPKCEVSAKATIEATAKCDATVEPGSVQASCEGKCEVDPGKVDLEASCEGEAKAELTCTGTAPNLECEGSCSGSCELDVAAKCDGKCTGGCQVAASGECEGECIGECSGECSGGCAIEVEGECGGKCEGECSGSTDEGGHCDGTCTGKCEMEAQGSCDGECRGSCSASCTGKCEVDVDGECSGECSGSCELSAGGSCSGKCTGSCEYTPPEAKCEGGAKAEVECKVEGDVEPPKVKCEAECSGEVTPPKASAECEASAKADAELKAECTPPSIGLEYSLKSTGTIEGDLAAQAEFEAWLTGFKANMGALLAAQAKADIVLKAGANIVTAAEGAVKGAVEAMDVSGDAAAAFKLVNCGIPALGEVEGIITGAAGELEASVGASVSLVGALGK